MNDLSKEHKQLFEKQIEHITSNDELKVLKNIENEIEKLKKIVSENHSHKMINLINNTEYLRNVLIDKDFPLSETTRKWIVFGLGYLISEYDIIPDNIPLIGYSDDTLIIQWVMYMIDKDLSKYNVYLRAKELSISSAILETIKQGKNNQQIIVIPGFMTGINAPETNEFWLSKTLNSIPRFAESSLKILRWNLNHLKEFSDTIRLVDHQLTLKPIYDHKEFAIEWEQLKIESSLLGEALANELLNDNIHDQTIFIAFDSGCITAAKAIEILPENSIFEYNCFGGTALVENLPQNHYKKVKSTNNYFSTNDLVLRFIFENFEKFKKPIGLTPIIVSKNIDVENFNSSEVIKSHSEYKINFQNLLL